MDVMNVANTSNIVSNAEKSELEKKYEQHIPKESEKSAKVLFEICHQYDDEKCRNSLPEMVSGP